MRRIVHRMLVLLFAFALAGGIVVRACPPDEGSGGVILPVETILQNPELPNGCEITSLTILLNYLGFEAGKTDMADNYLPRQSGWNGADPEVVYPGNPRTTAGWYCWPGPIVEAANSYLADQGYAHLEGVDITGADQELIHEYLRSGMPVVAWVTIDWSSSLRRSGSRSWNLPDGTRYVPYTNVHCLVITGIDGDTVYLANPLNTGSEMEAEQFFAIFESVGSRAMVIQAITE